MSRDTPGNKKGSNAHPRNNQSEKLLKYLRGKTFEKLKLFSNLINMESSFHLLEETANNVIDLEVDTVNAYITDKSKVSNVECI